MGPRRTVQDIGEPETLRASRRGRGWTAYRWWVVGIWELCQHKWQEITDELILPGDEPNPPDPPRTGNCPYCPPTLIEPGLEPPSKREEEPWAWPVTVVMGLGLLATLATILWRIIH